MLIISHLSRSGPNAAGVDGLGRGKYLNKMRYFLDFGLLAYIL
jgi:hypothetical protein